MMRVLFDIYSKDNHIDDDDEEVSNRNDDSDDEVYHRRLSSDHTITLSPDLPS
jgi:hypothetical protein